MSQAVVGAFDAVQSDATLTSVTDGTHGSTTLHKHGFAMDWRTRHLNDAEKTLLEAEARERLGPEFDVVLEGSHLHTEWDPR